MVKFAKFLHRALLGLLCLFKWIQAVPICGVDLEMAEISTNRSWIEEALAETNLERANHGVPPLVLNEELGKISQHWANRLATKYKKPVHTRVAKEYQNQTAIVDCGENIYLYESNNKGEVTNGAIPAREWYDEIYEYDYRTWASKNGKEIGHFAQAVWKATVQVGFALSVNSEGQNFVVATYKPPGNWEGEFLSNVLLPISVLAPIRGVQLESPWSGPKEHPPPTLQLLAPGIQTLHAAQVAPPVQTYAATNGTLVAPHHTSAPSNPVQGTHAKVKTSVAAPSSEKMAQKTKKAKKPIVETVSKSHHHSSIPVHEPTFKSGAKSKNKPKEKSKKKT